ncbi:MAG: lipoprotein NlpD [Gammaproteobacteria bacterium]|nr:lipoprotein NlpD [Gammaproteobacteria bacterium]|tara:strand:- start:118 stop:849 length:732 start_codon:yes stop_codon:yes gene_type:complete
MVKNKFFIFYLILLLAITGCTKIHNHSAKKVLPKKEPRKERVYFTYGLQSRQAEEFGDIYIVKEGDSLSSISFLYDVSYKKIAKWNNINKPYKISVGDEIVIKSKKFRKKVISKNEKLKFKSNLSWSRPHNGAISKEFSYSDIGKKGIDISGNIGDEIYSASDGVVVYTGNGIKGYGNLIIIKHNDSFLTAYAHTSKILVQENNSVVKGQVIANLGDSDSIKPILHFQVRKNGKSVDPEKYIP